MSAATRLGPWIAAAACLALAGTAEAGIPDWAKAVVDVAPVVAAEGVPEWPQRTLLAETSVVVSSDGATWRIARRKVVQVLSNRVDDAAFEFFQFDDTTKIKKAKGWHIPPGERAQRNTGGAMDLSLPGDFLTDAKARVIALEGIKKGSIVVYEFEAEGHPYTLTAVESFYDDVPISVGRWSIELPPGWSLKSAWLPDSGPEPVRSGATWTFERRDIVPEREEPMAENPVILAPRLVVALTPPDGVTTTTPAFGDWDAVGRWYQALAGGRETVTPEIQAAVNDALAKARSSPLDKIRAVSLFVRDRVRYLSREVGIGGYQPHSAGQVLSELYGDCKDKGTLLRSALQAAGFASYPILIHASNPYTVAPGVPAPGAFNHFVIGVVWPKDAPYPDDAASARVDAGDAGTLLVVDPTDERAWPGTLPGNLAGKTGLVVAGSRGLLLTLPDGTPSAHRVVRDAKVTIAADRSVAVQLVSRFYGGPAEEARAAHAASAKDRRERVEDGLRDAWPGAEIKSYEITPEGSDGAYVEIVALTIPAGASALQEKTFWMFAGATHDIDRVALGKRKTPVQYDYPFELRYETSVTGAAPSSETPIPLKLSGAGWSVETSFRRESGAVRGTWTAVLSSTRFTPATFSDLKQFWSAATKAAAPGLMLP